MASEIYNELKRLVQSRVGFEKGIERTLNDTHLGYVQNLHNMESSSSANRAVVRRSGTKRINKGTVPQKWYWIRTEKISGAVIIFGLNYKRELWAWLEEWPEVDLKVCSKSLTIDYVHFASAADTYTDQHVTFRRGSNFFWVPSDKYIDISNDYGDIFRIDKRGFIKFAIQTAPISIVLDDNITDARYSRSTSSIGMYVDVRDISHREMTIDPILIESDTNEFTPIIGSVRYARINEYGEMGLWTDTKIVENWKESYVSLFDGLSINSDNQISCNFISEADDGDYAEATSDVIYGWRESTGTVLNTPFSPTVDTSSAGTLVDVPVRLVYCIDNDPLGTGATAPFTNETLYMYMDDDYIDYVGNAEASIASNASIGNLFTLKRIRQHVISSPFVTTLATYDGRLGSMDTYISGSGLTADIVKNPDVTAAGFDNSAGVYGTIGSVSGLVVQSAVIAPETSEYTSGTYYPIAKGFLDIDTGYQINILTSASAVDYVFQGAIFKASVSMRVSGAASAATLTIPNRAYRYNSKIISADSVVLCDHRTKKFDCWEFTTTTTDALLGSEFIDPITKKIEINTSGSVLLDDTDDVVTDFLTNGYRFAVWNNGKVIAKSQRGWRKESTNDFLYETTKVVRSGTDWNINRLPFAFNKLYSPVIALENTGIRSYPKSISELENIVGNPRFIVNNNNKLYVCQGNEIWTGDLTWKLKGKIEVSYTILDMARFNYGILVAGNDGVYYINGKNESTPITDGQGIIAKKVQEGDGGVFIIDTDNKFYFAYMAITQSGGQYPRIIPISNSIEEANFSTSPKTAFVKDTFYIADRENVWGYSQTRVAGVQGTDTFEGGWVKKYNYSGRIIGVLGEYKGELIVSIENGLSKIDVFENPVGGGA